MTTPEPPQAPQQPNQSQPVWGEPAPAVPAPVGDPNYQQMPPQFGMQPPAPKQKNTLGLVALIVSIVGFIFACIPGALILGWILLPIAFILSIVAIVLPRKKKALALTGLIISIVGTIVGFVVFFSVVAGAAQDAFGSTDASVSQSQDEGDETVPAEEEAPAEEPEAELGSMENPAAIGSEITGDDFTVVVNSIDLDATDAVMEANQFNKKPEAGFTYAVINATVSYTGEDSSYAAEVGIAYVADGKVYNSFDAGVVGPEPTFGLDELYTGGETTGNVVIAVPVDANGLIRVTPGMLADDIFVAVK